MASATTIMFMVCGLSFDLMTVAHANEFLKHPPQALRELVSEQDIQVSLLDEVEGSLGTGSATKRLSEMEAILRPIIAALPKNQHDNLGHAAVRYALHRLFVLRHGWVITGLGADGDASNSGSPAGVLKDRVPAYIEGLFEKRLSGKGFGLHEVAVLAATVEHLIHNEAVSRLGSAFNVHMLPLTASINEASARDVLDTYMTTFILGENLKNMTLEDAVSLKAEMPEIFLAWHDTQKFVHDVQANVTKGDSNLDFASLAKVAEIVGEQFGSFQDAECRELKGKLMDMEYRGTGRVKLSDFYKPALGGAWTFQESVSYLRSLGLLDESDPNQPSVMIANYVTSKTNCIASSGFYSVCCKNECEGLLGHIEENIGASEAKPAAIAALVAKLPSSTIHFVPNASGTAPSTLSTNLLQRLDDIAANHAGTVPLHGRLFAQWMHHVYPRECPYPHISGTTESKLVDEWMDQSGTEGTASEEEMRQFVTQAENVSTILVQDDLPVEDMMPWSPEEELVVVGPLTSEEILRPAASTPAAMRSMVLLTIAGSLSFAMIQGLQATSELGKGRALPKYVI